MSFLNPVNEPVLRFSSTDPDAPQINYNSRVAGDVKTVLKACLVTGYGAKSSAGWSIVSEVNHVAEFVSPSVAMSDYRLGIDDTSTSSTTWYYQYRDVRTNPSYNSPSKSLGSQINKAHANNGWILLATNRGIVFIELVQSNFANKLSARMTYIGNVKSCLTTNQEAVNMTFFNIGHGATILDPASFYNTAYPHLALDTYTSTRFYGAVPFSAGNNFYAPSLSTLDIASKLFLTNATGDSVVIAELPALLAVVINNTADMYGVSDITVGGRQCVKITCGHDISQSAKIYSISRTFYIMLDYWEY